MSLYSFVDTGPTTTSSFLLGMLLKYIRVLLHVQSLKFVEIMRKEVKELALLRHPNILRVIDVRVHNDDCKLNNHCKLLQPSPLRGGHVKIVLRR